MKTYEFDWVDAFTRTPFAGNGCVVVHGAADIDVQDRMRLVRETKLSECAYVVPSEKADFGARYYLAGREILMAGHPTIATVASLIDRGLVDLSAGHAAFTLEVGAGVLPITVSGRGPEALITMTQAAPHFGARFDPGKIAGLYGLAAEDVIGAPQLVSTGSTYCITVLRDRAAIDRAVLDLARLAAWQATLDRPDATAIEPFLVTLSGATPAGDTYARLLLPPPNPPEDPFTGSATGCMAAYLWHHGLIESARFTAEQGHGMGRPAQGAVEVLGPREAISGVRLGGHGVVLMSGTLRLA
ncbi:PhzF family phenazine biosynthesis protein [Halovulum dunhuangense]|uniref:PhzF family phenazine biosynthesis protein n=1 Tax=Halovulum dunhuangense TaxID=1505036 RepID=A0A849L2L9_9RHOB|nr:PhzF family phenazine biosynthesis protein [Halovulum dunhuangense]NNU80566.1 PhzF family phenazine biosynthesis protein [Halovulum dunhuangense]